ncbi:hypothetical protein Trydic_g14571, partial [Trypoxylus dichotomus]
CNYGSPVLLAQMGVNTNQLKVWEVLQCGKRCILEPHAVTTSVLKQVYVAMQWTSEGGLFLLDKWADIYTVNAEYKTELVIKCEHPGDKPVYFSWYKAGLTVACPNGTIMMGVNTNQLKVWEVLQCGKRCILEPHAVTTSVLKQVYVAMQWTSEGGLFLLDKWADIYTDIGFVGDRLTLNTKRNWSSNASIPETSRFTLAGTKPD